MHKGEKYKSRHFRLPRARPVLLLVLDQLGVPLRDLRLNWKSKVIQLPSARRRRQQRGQGPRRLGGEGIGLCRRGRAPIHSPPPRLNGRNRAGGTKWKWNSPVSNTSRVTQAGQARQVSPRPLRSSSSRARSTRMFKSGSAERERREETTFRRIFRCGRQEKKVVKTASAPRPPRRRLTPAGKRRRGSSTSSTTSRRPKSWNSFIREAPTSFAAARHCDHEFVVDVVGFAQFI